MARVAPIVLSALVAALVLPSAGLSPAQATATPTITTVAGTVGAGPSYAVGQLPHAVVLRAGELFVADPASNVVRAIRLSDGMERVVAGNGSQAFVPEDAGGTEALSTGLYGPVSIAFDPAGNLYIAESSGGRIRKVTPGGGISIVAGNSGQGYSGDGGPATSATFSYPEAVAVDGAGNLFVADSLNHRIRRVDGATGVITTFAGTGEAGDGGDGGAATAARLRQPQALAVDLSGTSLLVADTGNARIRRIDLATGVITTVAGTGTVGSSGDGGAATAAELRDPAGITPHTGGGFVIADTGNHRIRSVDASGRITLIAGNGTRHYGEDGVPATDTNLFAPEGVAVGPDGRIYVGDTRASRVRIIDLDGYIYAIGGTYYPHWNGEVTGPTAQISPPRGVAVAASGDVYISDTSTHLIRRLRASDGYLLRVAGTGNYGDTGDGGPATSAELGAPAGITLAADGDVVFADDAKNKVRRIDVASGVITTVAGTGDRGFSGDGGPASAAMLAGPTDVAVAPDGSVLVADQGNHRVRRVGVDGTITTVAGTGSDTASGNGGPATQAALPWPTGLAVATDGTTYVSDTGYGKVRRIDPRGIVTTYAGSGTSYGRPGDGGPALSAELRSPWGLDLDDAGNLYIADAFSFAVRRVDRSGTIDRVAGNGRSGFQGDGGAPTAARLNMPLDVAVDNDGTSVYIADFLNLRIRRATVTPPQAAPTTTTTTTTTPTRPTAPPAGSPAARSGYWMVSATGQVYSFGDASWLGNAPVGPSNAVDVATTPSGRGYWVVAAQGTVYPFGDAPYLGGAGPLGPGETVTSLSATPTGRGYWLFTSAGRVLAFGDAVFAGDMTGTRLNGPVRDSVPTPTGRGYYMVASDGGIFAFGDARFAGSMGATRLNAPVRALAPDKDGAGYWLVAEDGGIFAFDAGYHGSMGGTRLNRPITGIVASGGGYLLVAEDGGIFAFGTAVFRGSLGGNPPPAAVASMTPLS
ncbi:MAG: SMP-30/gluconolactonase/LRE family protein [Acidimicrobiales bacterium]